MMRRTSIFSSKEVEKLERPSQKNFSKRMANICDRFSEVMRVEYPGKKFTLTEKEFLKEYFSDKILKPAAVIHSIAKDIEYTDYLCQKFEVDKDKLLDKLKKLSYVQTVSLIEHIEEYWDSIRGNHENANM